MRVLEWRAIPPGRAGTSGTLAIMRGLVHEAVKLPGFVAWARGFGSDEAMDRFMRRHIAYTPKPFQVLVRPERMVEEIKRYGFTQGNCADAAMLAAAVHTARGIPAAFVALHTDPAEAGFQHVFEIRRDSRAAFDVTVPAGTRYQFLEAMEAPV